MGFTLQKHTFLLAREIAHGKKKQRKKVRVFLWQSLKTVAN